MVLKSATWSLILSLYVFSAFSQNKTPIKFGNVTAEDFNISHLKVDTTSGAVIIADVGESSFEGSSNSWFTLIHKRQCRIKIINKSSFDLADVEIPLYINNTGKEEIQKIKAYTYNLEDGKVVELKLGNDAIFEDKYDKNHILKKFTMPGVKEGSIIEYSYTIKSDFLFNLRPWRFQGRHPIVWSEYVTNIPEFFRYVALTQGYRSYDIKEKRTNRGSYNIRVQNFGDYMRDEVITLKGDEIESRWVMKNVPLLKEEKFVSAIDNHISKIEFQLSGIQFPGRPYEDVMGNWQKVANTLLKDEDFGEALTKNNNWMADELRIITASAIDTMGKVRAIFNYIQNNIKCSGKRGLFLSKSLKQVFKEKNGASADMNLLLIAMLKHEEINADPVVLSTVKHGYTHELYPLINEYDYVICKASVKGQDYFLDVSDTYLGLGKLSADCYNGHARVINKNSVPIYFSPDTLNESKFTHVMLYYDEKENGKWEGPYHKSWGYYESYNIRKEIKQIGKNEYEKKIAVAYGNDYSVIDTKIKDIDNLENPITVGYTLATTFDTTQNIIYFAPMLNEGDKENYFKSQNRVYPVEMPYLIDETYTLNLDIPKDYVVDELPKSVKALFNDDEGIFEYYVSATNSSVIIHSRLKFMKATFPPEEYEFLRGFYDMVIKKHSEEIVFKKKNR